MRDQRSLSHEKRSYRSISPRWSLVVFAELLDAPLNHLVFLGKCEVHVVLLIQIGSGGPVPFCAAMSQQVPCSTLAVDSASGFALSVSIFIFYQKYN